jgi:hypothetical protein
LTRPPVPEIVPEKVPAVVSTTVSILPPSLTALLLPVPPRFWILWLPPVEISSAAEPLRVTALLTAIEPPGPSARVPALIVVGPDPAHCIETLPRHEISNNM